MLEDTRLKIFMAVADEGSFTRAAYLLGITQPAVSQNIAELERLTGRTLHEQTPIMVQIRNRQGETAKTSLAFKHTDEAAEQTFAIETPQGDCEVEFIFLPGCHFDFYSFCFGEVQDGL